MYNGPHIPQKDLKVYLDITNSDCYEANDIADPIVADTKLYNLADKSFTEYFYNIQNTEAYQQTVTPTQLPILCMQHDAFEGNTNRDTTWFSATSVPRVLSYSFVCWYKFDNVNQQSENIYLFICHQVVQVLILMYYFIVLLDQQMVGQLVLVTKSMIINGT